MLQSHSSPHTRKASFASAWNEDPVEAALLVALVAGLAWAPFWLGGNRMVPWGVNGVYFPTLVVAYELSLLMRGRRHPVGIRQLAAPAALFCAVVAWIYVQMSTAAPAAMVHPIWNMASDVLGAPIAGSISVNRGATGLALMRLLTDASVLWLAIQLSREASRALLLMRAVGFIVAAYSAYGLLLAAFYSSGIPFFDVEPTGGVRATFVNRNSFATYAGLGLVTMAALTLRLYRHEVPGHEDLRAYRMHKLIEATGRRGWLYMGATLIILAALLATVSRGGILAAGLGLAALLLLSFTRQRRRRGEQLEAIIFLTAVVVGAFLVFGDRIAGRIALSGLIDVSRSSVYAITLNSILDAPVLGFGYGTFADVFPMYRDQSISAAGVWDKAHNTYLEVWQGLGLVFGTALMAALGWLIYVSFVGAIRRRRDATAPIVAAAVALLVAAHALVDFSLQIEAVTLTFMALLGAGVAQSESSRHAVSD